MLLRSHKKYSREVSLYEPIGVDKDGESIHLVDVIQMENEDVLEQMILDQDVRELYQAYKTCLNDNEKQVVQDALWAVWRKRVYSAGRLRRPWACPDLISAGSKNGD